MSYVAMFNVVQIQHSVTERLVELAFVVIKVGNFGYRAGQAVE